MAETTTNDENKLPRKSTGFGDFGSSDIRKSLGLKNNIKVWFNSIY